MFFSLPEVYCNEKWVNLRSIRIQIIEIIWAGDGRVRVGNELPAGYSTLQLLPLSQRSPSHVTFKILRVYFLMTFIRYLKQLLKSLTECLWWLWFIWYVGLKICNDSFDEKIVIIYFRKLKRSDQYPSRSLAGNLIEAWRKWPKWVAFKYIFTDNDCIFQICVCKKCVQLKLSQHGVRNWLIIISAGRSIFTANMNCMLDDLHTTIKPLI